MKQISLTVFWAFAILYPSFLHAQGSLTPPGAPTPTMITLSQIEPRTPISAPVFINRPGSYYLTTNITVNSGTVITIQGNNVRVDLNGFTISSTASPASGYAIFIGNSFPSTNVVVFNGFISSGVTNNNSGVFNGSGFGYGIFANGINIQIKNVSVSGCLDDGINAGIGSSVVEACTVNTAGGSGIFCQSVSDSTATNCGFFGINAVTVNNCYGQSYVYGINAITANNCFGNGSTGSGITAYSAENCYGTSSTGFGLDTHSAHNCSGITGPSGIAGLRAFSADNCYGFSSGNGDGIDAETANICDGQSQGNGAGVNANSIAIGCYGNSTHGIGISALIANVCHGVTSTGTALSVTHNINSF